MSKNRQRVPVRQWHLVLVITSLLIFLGALPSRGNPPAQAWQRGMGGQSPVVILSGEFFQAMEKLSNSDVVSGDRQEMFLQQIATAERFVVKTNLALIEQNEKIIKLLEDLKRQGQRDAQ